MRRRLDHTLLLMRSAELLPLVSDAAEAEGWHPTEAIARVYCDGCGKTVDLIHEPWPDGWTTDGNLNEGFDDRCETCTRELT